MPKRKYPGVKPTREKDGFEIRATAVDPRTGKLREKFRIVRGPEWTFTRAVALHEDLKREIVRGDRVLVARDQTLGEFARSWLQRHLPFLESKTTQERYEDALVNHILPIFGDWLVAEIAKVDLEKWIADKSTAGYANDTINGWWRILKQMLQAAVEDLDLPKDPTLKVKPLPSKEVEGNTLSAEELVRFLQVARNEYPQWYAMILLGFSIGARPGELRPLRRVEDIEWDTGKLSLRRSQRRKQLGPTKTKKKREVYLPAEVVHVLGWHIERMNEINHPGASSELLFPSMGRGRWAVRRAGMEVSPDPDVQRNRDYHREWNRRRRAEKRRGRESPGAGSFVSASCLDKPFDEISKKAGIRGGITPKAMRRTFNDLLRNRANNLVIQSITGHRSDEMQDRYSTIGAEEKRAAVATVVALAGGASLVPTGSGGGEPAEGRDRTEAAA